MSLAIILIALIPIFATLILFIDEIKTAFRYLWHRIHNLFSHSGRRSRNHDRNVRELINNDPYYSSLNFRCPSVNERDELSMKMKNDMEEFVKKKR